MKKIALPIKENRLSPHFGNCSYFRIFSIENDIVVKEEIIPAPPHQPDSVPIWLAEKGVSDVIAAGIGIKAIKILTRHKISVFAGVKAKEPEVLIQEYLDGTLETNGNLCDH